MIVVIDPFNRGLSHVPFNAGLIETAHAAEPECKILVAAEKDHLAGLAELVCPEIWCNVQQIPIIPAPAGTSFKPRLKVDFHNLRKVFDASTGNATIVLADLAPSTLYALRLNHLRNRSAFSRFAAVLHGNAAEIAGWRARNPLIRLTQLRSAMAHAPAKTRFIILENSIRLALAEIAPEHEPSLCTLAHPIPTGEAARNTTSAGLAELPLSRPVRIGFLGAAQGKKGFDGFLALARTLTQRFPGRVEFHAIGWLPPENAGQDFSCLTRAPSPVKLDRREFLEALGEVDYVCMPYSQEVYRYSASGTLLDAASAHKPIIALRSPLFEDLLQEFGDIGEFADSLDQLEGLAAKLIAEHDPTRYRHRATAMAKLCKARLPKNLAPSWNALFKHS